MAEINSENQFNIYKNSEQFSCTIILKFKNHLNILQKVINKYCLPIKIEEKLDLKYFSWRYIILNLCLEEEELICV